MAYIIAVNVSRRIGPKNCLLGAHDRRLPFCPTQVATVCVTMSTIRYVKQTSSTLFACKVCYPCLVSSFG